MYGKGSIMAVREEVHDYDITYPQTATTVWRRMSWGAIFAGLFVTLAIFATLQLLGAGIGLSSVDLTGRDTSSGKALGIGAAIWWLIAGLISLFIGGWVAGRLSSQPGKLERALHGFTTWAFFYVVMLWLMTTAMSALAGGGLSLLGRGLSAAGQAATSPQGREAMNSSNIQQQIASAMGVNSPQQAQQMAGELAAPVTTYLGSSKTPQDRQQLAQAITQKTGRSEAEANQMIDNLDRTAQQAKETGQQAANITGASLIGLSVSMILGAIVAILGSIARTAPRVIVTPPERTRTRTAETEAGVYASSAR
jgi:hypothetical protein